MNDGARGLHHGVALVVLYQVREGVEGLAATGVETALLRKR